MEAGVHTSFSADKSVITIFIEGDFNFSLLSDFKKAYNNSNALAAETVIVDLSATATVDSSALGMLLGMQRDMNKSDGQIKVINCNDLVRKIFTMTHLDRKFNVE